MGSAYLPLAPGETTLTDASGNVTVLDPSGNPVGTFNPTPIWDSSPTTIDTPVNSGGGTDLSTIGTFFANIGAGIGGIIRGIQGGQAPICPTTLPCAAPNRPGFLYNPQTGQYIPSTGFPGYTGTLSAGSGLGFIVILGVLLFLLVGRGK